MKKLIQAASVVSVGAASTLLAAEGGTKPWTVSAGVRGFYDDNIFTRSSATGLKEHSYGLEFTPSVNINLPFEQTTLTAGYTYGLRWYENRKNDKTDQFHLANVGLAHTFSPRVKINLFDTLAIAQEPEQFAPLNGQLARSEGDNLRNTAGFDLDLQISRLWTAVVGYRNVLVDYSFAPYARSLNRMEHIPSVDFRYQFSAKTVGVIGYSLHDLDYGYKVGGLDVSNWRDNLGHSVYAGVDHSFTSSLIGSVRAGAQFTEWDKDELKAVGIVNTAASKTSPYVDASLTYAYTTGSSAQIGVRHTRNPTDVDIIQAGDGTLDQESTMVYGSISHAWTPKLRSSLIAQYQNSEFNGGGIGINHENEDYFTIGVALNYKFTHWLSGEAAYYYDQLDSKLKFGGLDREYSRNRVFLGVRASY